MSTHSDTIIFPQMQLQQRNRGWAARLNNIWWHMTEPHPSIIDPHRRRQARVTVMLIVMLLGLVSVGLIGYTLVALLLPPLALCYVLARSPFVRIAGVAALLLLTMPTYLSLMGGGASPSQVISATHWLLLPVILSSLMLPVAGTVLILGINLALMSVLLILPGTIAPDEIFHTVGFLLVIGVFAVLSQMVYTRYLVQQQMADLRATQRELEITNSHLAAANKEIKSFAYIVAHDLRSPLVNIIGFMDEVRMAAQDIMPIFDLVPPDANPTVYETAKEALLTDLREAVDYIDTSTNKMEHLIHEVLTLSRAGQRELHRELLDMNALVAEAVDTLRHKAEQAKVTIDVGKLPSIYADRVAMEQIMANMIDNAIKYRHPKRPGFVSISAEHRLDEMVFAVADNGRGIKATDHEKVFQLFRRAGDADAVPGNGLGLPYVQTLVKRHGGRVWFTSIEGEGTTFYVAIPDHTAVSRW